MHETVSGCFCFSNRERSFLSINVIVPTESVSGTIPYVSIWLTRSVIKAASSGPAYFSIETVTPSTPGALWSLSLFMMATIFWLETLAYTLVLC